MKSDERKPTDGTTTSRWTPLWYLTLARLREFWREPAAVFWVYGFPLLMMVALGVAFSNRSVDTIVVMVEQGEDAKHLMQVFADDERFRAQVATPERWQQELHAGKADLAIVVPPPASEAPAEYQFHYDPTRPGSQIARNAADDALQRVAGRMDVIRITDHQVSRSGSRYIDFLVPGLIGMGIMGGGLWGVGFAIVDMRIRKLLKRYLATPMKRSHFLAAIMISRLMFTIPEILFLLVVARFSFGVVNQGSYLTVGLLILLGTVQFAGVGLLIASRAQTLETVSGLMNLAMLPMWMGSGIFFSYERFPELFQPVLRLLPLTPLIDALRATMTMDAGIYSLGSEITIICAWAVVTFFMALRFFRWN